MLIETRPDDTDEGEKAEQAPHAGNDMLPRRPAQPLADAGETPCNRACGEGGK
jgi:hypothetical protein